MTLSTQQAARRLNVSTERLRALEKEGKLHPEVTPLGRLWDEDEVEALAKARKAEYEAGNWRLRKAAE